MITRQYNIKPQGPSLEQSLHMMRTRAKLQKKRDALQHMSSAQLRECWFETFGERPPNAYGIAILVGDLTRNLESRIQILLKLATSHTSPAVPVSKRPFTLGSYPTGGIPMTPLNFKQKLALLQKMSPLEIHTLWKQTFGTEAPSATSTALIEPLADRLEDIPNDLKAKYTSHSIAAPLPKTVKYHPVPGRKRSRTYKGALLVVEEVEGGFKFEGKIYRSYSAITQKVTGQRRNGADFFGLKSPPPKCVRVLA